MTRHSGSRTAIALGAAALLFFTFAFGLRLMWLSAESFLPPLLHELPDSLAEADQQVFLARLKQAFPIGTAEADILATLREQGFKVGAADRVATFDHRAGLTDKCRRSGNVRWNLDGGGRVNSISGGYYQHCPAH